MFDRMSPEKYAKAKGRAQAGNRSAALAREAIDSRRSDKDRDTAFKALIQHEGSRGAAKRRMKEELDKIAPAKRGIISRLLG
ncbi:hypothetical protein [Nonomuraea sp. NPDC050786]|uniref:hypothetical protein n=1 Tax=Nonomuraea sp. NPDC050786 TaxID=3154840 RepID=UPI0033E65B0E